MTKTLFVESIEAIKNQLQHDKKCNDSFKKILSNDFITGYNNSKVVNQLIKVLQMAFEDFHKDSWIEYFIWELDFGKKYSEGCASYKDGTNINLSTAKHLYNFLQREKEIKLN